MLTSRNVSLGDAQRLIAVGIDGEIVGGIGVSGGSGKQDSDIARAIAVAI